MKKKKKVKRRTKKVKAKRTKKPKLMKMGGRQEEAKLTELASVAAAIYLDNLEDRENMWYTTFVLGYTREDPEVKAAARMLHDWNEMGADLEEMLKPEIDKLRTRKSLLVN